MYLYLIFGMYLKKVFVNTIKYTYKLPTKGKALSDIMFFTPVVWSTVGRQHWKKLAYGEASQTVASINEWEAS